MRIDPKLLDFVTDGFKFDAQVVKTKAKHTIPYNPVQVKEIFQNKNDLGNDIYIMKRTKSVIFNKYPVNNKLVN
jgi:hypothetical protein